MARIEVNTTDEKYQGLIDEADYIIHCADVEIVDVKSQEGKKQLKWIFATTWEDAEAGLTREIELVRFTPLSGKGVGFTRDVLKALDVEFEDSGASLSFDTDDCKGRDCLASVKNETREGRTNNVISTFAQLT